MNEEYIEIAPFPIYMEPPQKTSDDQRYLLPIKPPLDTIDIRPFPVYEPPLVTPIKGAQPSIRDALIPLFIYVGMYYVAKTIYEAVT